MRQAFLLDEDCGKLYETFTGKLKTSNIFQTNYTLEDISGFLNSGQKYRVIKSTGERGVMTKHFGGYYEYEPD